jgi:hypothetical protein
MSEQSLSRTSERPQTRPSQNERVLALLRQGPLAAVDLQPPNVVDGLAPVWRVAARIDALKHRGYEIRSDRRPDGTAIYQLISEPDVERAGGGTTSAASPCPPPVTDAVPTGSLSTGLFDLDEYRDAREAWKDVG